MLDKETYEQMKRLQKETSAGMLWCRDALRKYNGDFDKALIYLKSEEFKRHIRRGFR